MKKRYKILISLILAFVVLATVTFVFLFLFNNVQKKNKNFVELLKKTEELEQKNEKIKVLNESVQDVFDQKILLDKYFARKSDVVPFLDSMQSLATEAGTKGNFSFVDLSVDGLGLEVQMNVEGRFEGVYRFIKILENSPYVFEFTEMSLQRKDPMLTEDGSVVLNPVWILNLKMKLISFINN
jgi:hypothetical protein